MFDAIEDKDQVVFYFGEASMSVVFNHKYNSDQTALLMRCIGKQFCTLIRSGEELRTIGYSKIEYTFRPPKTWDDYFRGVDDLKRFIRCWGKCITPLPEPEREVPAMQMSLF